MLALLSTDGRDRLVRIGEVPEPSCAVDEVLIEVEAFSINRGETFQLERPRADWRPGKDIAGRVVQTAPDGSGPAIGSRVVGHVPQAGWGQLAAVQTDSVAVLPAAIESITAAALPLAGLTALRLLRAAGELPGRQLLITGASGGVGHYVTELASAAGAEVTVVSATPERARRLLALGAIRAVEDVAAAPGPFDAVLESVGGTSLPQALTQLRKGGLLIWFGQASRRPVELDFFAYFEQTGATIRHFHYEDSAIPISRDLTTLVRLVETGRLHPELGLVANWTQTATALQQLRDRRLRGNAVLCVPTHPRPERNPHDTVP
jgi:NADPH2:quinone reductase